MTCKDCVHYEICDGWNHKFMEMRVNGNNGVCKSFKPKSRFLELPCEVGSTVYFVGLLTQQIVPSKVLSISYNNGGFYLFCENHLIITVTEQLGKTVFLTKEEAEAELRKRGEE